MHTCRRSQVPTDLNKFQGEIFVCGFGLLQKPSNKDQPRGRGGWSLRRTLEVDGVRPDTVGKTCTFRL